MTTLSAYLPRCWHVTDTRAAQVLIIQRVRSASQCVPAWFCNITCADNRLVPLPRVVVHFLQMSVTLFSFFFFKGLYITFINIKAKVNVTLANK